MKTPDVLEYESSADFLKDFYAFKTATNPRFNYTIWSKKLGMGNVGSLTRLLNGQRAPGEKLVDSLCQYLEFSPNQAEYFRALIRMEKEKDPLLRSLFSSRLVYLRAQGRIDLADSSQPSLIELKSRLLLLWGSADCGPLNHYLSEFGLESILGYGVGRATVCLKASATHESKIGPFIEFNFASYVRRQDAPLKEFEMFMDKLWCPDPDICAQYRSWGSPYEERDVRVQLEEQKFPRRCEVGEPANKHLEFSMGDKLTNSNAQPNDMIGYNSIFGKDYCFRMKLNSTAQFRDFDSQVDVCRWDSNSEIGKFLDALGFQPTSWTYHEDFTALIYPPEPR